MMYQPDTEILFPTRIIPAMRHMRGAEWRQLIDYLCRHEDESHPDILAFSLVMIRLASCISCHADSYRALRGCTACSLQVVNRYKGTDRQLIAMWQEARLEVNEWLAKNPSYQHRHQPPPAVAAE